MLENTRMTKLWRSLQLITRVTYVKEVANILESFEVANHFSMLTLFYIIAIIRSLNIKMYNNSQIKIDEDDINIFSFLSLFNSNSTKCIKNKTNTMSSF